MKILRKLIPDGKIYAWMSLYPGKTKEEVGRILSMALGKRLLRSIPLLILIPFLFTLADKKAAVDRSGAETNVFQREDVNGAGIYLPIILKNPFGEREETLRINPVAMTDEEIDKMQEEVAKRLDSLVLGSNPSFDKLSGDLYFPEGLEDLPVLLAWSSSDPGTVTGKGDVLNSDIEESLPVTIAARVLYGNEFRLYERHVIVLPRIYDEAEALVRNQMKTIQAYEQSTLYEKEFYLPKNVEGGEVFLKEEKEISKSVIGIFISVVLFLAVFSNFFSSLNEKKKKRKDDAERDCKEFLSELSILLAAGLPLRSAWKKMTEDHVRAGAKGMLYENMAVTTREFTGGCTESTAYERFGERMETTRYQRIAAILSQSVTKGVSELPELLNAEIREVVAEEREKIKIRGEQAGTGLLMPMMGFLIIVFAILLVPAFISF